MPSAVNFPKLIFSFTLNRKTDRYSYHYYPSVSAQALETKSADESKSSNFKSVLDDFVNEVTTASNMYLFLYELNNGYRRHIMGSKLIPAVQEKGKKIDPVENYEESYELDARFSADHKFLFSQVAQSNRTRDALGPMILLNITARYDVLISGLLRIYFQTYPGLLDKSEKNFSLTELKRIGSIEEAEKQILDREIDSIMHASHRDQIDWISNRLKVKVLDYTREMPTFCEIFERRNLCAHTDLVVSKRYIANCLKYGLKEDEIQKIDRKINVGPKYLSEATAIIVEYGIIISHIIWRAIFKSDEGQIAAADKLLLAHAAMVSRSGRHELAERLLFLGYCKFKPSSDLFKREMIIGRAEALIMLDKLDDAQKIINEHDWTSSNTRMRIYRQAILGEEAGIEDLIKISKMENSITLDEYASSPAFSNLSLSPTFSKMLRNIFGAADQAGADLKSIFDNMYPDEDSNAAGKVPVKQKLPTEGRSSKIDIDAEAIVDASDKILEAAPKVAARRSRKSTGNKG